MIALPTLGHIPEPRTFRSLFGRTANPEYGWTASGAQRPISIPSKNHNRQNTWIGDKGLEETREVVSHVLAG